VRVACGGRCGVRDDVGVRRIENGVRGVVDVVVVGDVGDSDEEGAVVVGVV